MKRFFQIILFSICFCVLLVSCKSKEEKAAELIKKELSKVLYDFDSYQPIETVVTEAKLTMYNDSACRIKALAYGYGLKEVDKYIENCADANEKMKIWGPPTYYSSTYSDNQYYKYKDELKENVKKGEIALAACQKLSDELNKMIAELDTSKVIGWEAKHRFRCKTKGGNSTIGDYRYIIDKDFKKVILLEDLDDSEDQMIRKYLDGTLTDRNEAVSEPDESEIAEAKE